MILHILTAILVITGLCIVFGVNPADMGGAVFEKKKPQNAWEMVMQANGKSRENLFSRQFSRMRDVLALTGRTEQYRRYCAASVVCAAIGVIAAVLLQNPLLIPVWAATGLLLPPLYVMLTANHYSRMINDQTASALSLVSTAYLRTENLPINVRDCLPLMRGPVKRAFSAFWLQTQYANPNVERALQDMSGRLSSGVFHQWCETMQLCQHDHTQKDMLRPLLKRQDALQTKQIRMDGTLNGMIKDNRLMIVFALFGYLFLLLIDRNWFLLMFTSVPGKIVTAVVAAFVFFDLVRVTQATKPLRG